MPRSPSSPRLRYWLPLVLWIVAILLVSSVPGPTLAKVGFGIHDKLAHFAEYSVLGWLIMLAVAAVIGLAVAITRGDVAYVAVLVWAFAGIAVKQDYTTSVAIAAWAAAGVVALALLLGVPLQRERLREWRVAQTGPRDRW